MKPELVKRYVETGKVRLIWNDFAWIGEESRQAAQAARCAGRQGKFWEYHDHLYANQRGENQGQFSGQNLRRFAQAVGLELAPFESCLQKGEDIPHIRQQVTTARNKRLRGTPSFIVGGQVFVGAPTPDGFARIIEAELARKGG